MASPGTLDGFSKDACWPTRGRSLAYPMALGGRYDLVFLSRWDVLWRTPLLDVRALPGWHAQRERRRRTVWLPRCAALHALTPHHSPHPPTAPVPHPACPPASQHLRAHRGGRAAGRRTAHGPLRRQRDAMARDSGAPATLPRPYPDLPRPSGTFRAPGRARVLPRSLEIARDRSRSLLIASDCFRAPGRARVLPSSARVPARHERRGSRALRDGLVRYLEIASDRF